MSRAKLVAIDHGRLAAGVTHRTAPASQLGTMVTIMISC